METLVLHMDLTARRTCAPREDVAENLGRFARAHGGLPRPQGAGRFVGER